jgi:hypothetical protein
MGMMWSAYPPLTAANLTRAIMSSTQVGSGIDRKGSL